MDRLRRERPLLEPGAHEERQRLPPGHTRYRPSRGSGNRLAPDPEAAGGTRVMDSRRLSASSPLQQPAATVVRGHTERLIQEADVAICRLADPNDVQALHDSRVALRRLRGWLRAFDIELSVKPKRRKALRRLARSTNKARDTEVSLEWLATLERKMYPKALVGLARFSTELRGMRDKDYRRVRRELPQAWRKLAHKMRRTALNGAGKGTPRPFQQDFMASLQAYGQDFERALARARRTPTPPRIHALPI